MAKSMNRRDASRLTLISPPDAEPGFILDAVAAHHSKVLKLCADLEGVADSLPGSVNPVACMALAKTLLPSLSLTHEFEEDQLFSLVRTIWPGRLGYYEPIMARLESDHRQDQGYAQEIVEVLSDWAMCADTCNAETTGYMLRGFFEGLRRQIWFEQVVLINPIKDYLSHPGEIAGRGQ